MCRAVHALCCAAERVLEPRHETWSVAGQHYTEISTCDQIEGTCGLRIVTKTLLKKTYYKHTRNEHNHEKHKQKHKHTQTNHITAQKHQKNHTKKNNHKKNVSLCCVFVCPGFWCLLRNFLEGGEGEAGEKRCDCWCSVCGCFCL